MNPNTFRKHKILTEYHKLQGKRDSLVVDYCSLLTKLTKVTKPLSPMPPGGGSDYDEDIEKLAKLKQQIQNVTYKMRRIKTAIRMLPNRENFVLYRFYISGDSLDRIAKDLGKSYSLICKIKAWGLEKIDL